MSANKNNITKIDRRQKKIGRIKKFILRRKIKLANKRIAKRLDDLNVPKSGYALVGELKNDATNVELMADGTYAVYYMERDEKCGIKYYDNIDDAYEKLYQTMRYNYDSCFRALVNSLRRK